MEREWRVIDGYDGRYEISNFGEIKSKWGKGRILKSYPNKDGYKCVNLHLNDKRGFYTVHRLVGNYFIPNPENKPQIDHINRIKDDNRVINLRWVTQNENQLNRDIQKNNTTGFKNILKIRTGFRVKITRNKKSYRKQFQSKEDAIEWRNAMYDDLDG